MIRRDETEAAAHGTAGSSRRRFVQLTGAGLAVALGRSLCGGAEAGDQRPKVLKHGDEIEIGGQAKAIIRRAYELGHQYEKQHGG